MDGRRFEFEYSTRIDASNSYVRPVSVASGIAWAALWTVGMVTNDEYGSGVLLAGVAGTGISAALGAWAGHIITDANMHPVYWAKVQSRICPVVNVKLAMRTRSHALHASLFFKL